MKWVADSEQLKPRHYVIEHDPAVGFYLFVFEGDESKYDYLQDTLDIAMSQAEEKFGVPRSSWRQISNEPTS